MNQASRTIARRCSEVPRASNHDSQNGAAKDPNALETGGWFDDNLMC